MSVQPVFLLSLPRSGSTLLQRLLGAHSKVATTAEPWLLLPSLYALRDEGVFTEYGHSTAVRALNGVCDSLPGGESDYFNAVATMATEVYDRLSPVEATVFLDKTPRYGLIIDELMATFPDAPMIVLHRNPLAVIASITATFDGGRWKPYHHKQDLFLLADRLLSAVQREPHRFVSLRYEDLLSEPESTLQRLTAELGLEWEPSLLTDFTSVSVKGNVGDPTGTESYRRLSAEPLSKWRNELACPIRRSWARRYLNWLGRERLALMGYDIHPMLSDLNDLPSDYSTLLADAANTVKGAVWSATEVEIARSKIRRLPNWRNIFSHT